MSISIAHNLYFLVCLFTVLVYLCFVFPFWFIYFVLHTCISFDSSFALRPKNVIYPTSNALTIMPSIGITTNTVLIARPYVLYCSVIFFSSLIEAPKKFSRISRINCFLQVPVGKCHTHTAMKKDLYLILAQCYPKIQ